MIEMHAPINSVYVGHGDAFEEGYNQQRNVAAEIVEQSKDVISGAVREHDR